MILSSLPQVARLERLHPLFPAAFRFLREESARKDLPDGRTDIDGDHLYILAMQGVGRPPAEAPLETHRRYIDIQYVVSGIDRIGWKPVADCGSGRGYDEARDLELFDVKPDTWFEVSAGQLAVFFPDDAHAPLANPGVPLYKIVVKVAV